MSDNVTLFNFDLRCPKAAWTHGLFSRDLKATMVPTLESPMRDINVLTCPILVLRVIWSATPLALENIHRELFHRYMRNGNNHPFARCGRDRA